jgi:glycosyltransferase involved in cell wall biosynthesis
MKKLKKFLYRLPVERGNGAFASAAESAGPKGTGGSVQSFRLSFMRRQLTFPAVVISPSLHLKKRYEAEGFREILYLAHGFVPRQKIVNAPFNGRLVIAYLGNITPVKGADVLLREMKFVSRGHDIRLLFFGRVLDEVYQASLEALAEECPDIRIEFRGPYNGADALRGILADVHVAVFPSVWEENHPLVVREALSYGVPVIGSCLGGTPEAIEDGVNGLIFDPRREGDLAARINLILEDTGILETLRTGAKNTRIETIEDHMKKILGIYDHAIRTLRG